MKSDSVVELTSGKLLIFDLMFTPSFKVWAQSMRDDITSSPIGWAHTQNDPCITMVSQEHRGVSNHWQFICYFNNLFKLTSQKTSKLCITGPLWWESTITGGFLSQRASNMESISILWCQHVGDSWVHFTIDKSTFMEISIIWLSYKLWLSNCYETLHITDLCGHDIHKIL